MSSIHEYQVDHLLLLVGSNPLPNAVAGKLLVAAGGMITLIHSQDTASLAERLESWLKSGGDSEAPVAHVDLAEVKESDADSVYRRVEKVLRDYESKARQMGRVRMGLHYTGGTKVMSVHAYRALEDWARDQSREREALFSYLDAHTLNMYIEGIAGKDTLSFYAGRAVSISIDELVKMHGWEWQQGKKHIPQKPVTEPILPRSAATLLALHSKSDPADARKWADWLHTTLFPNARRRTPVPPPLWNVQSKQKVQEPLEQVSDRWESKTELRKQAIPWPEELPDLSDAMGEELGLVGSGDLKLAVATEQGHFKEEEEFCKWLNGGWLESAVLSALRDCSETLHLNGCCMNLYLIPARDQEQGHRVKFEFDVVAMRGYQLFAFSCTTESGNESGGTWLLKQKLFELCIRARQMGGDEACAALVGCMEQEKADKLEQEVRSAIGPEVHIRVFGREQLANLSQSIASWISEQSKEG